MQRRRLYFQLGFFALFLLAPALNLLRFDLTEAQLWVLGMRWSLGIDAFRAGHIGPTEVALSILLRGVLPVLLLAGAFLAVARRYGRLYCGWLCPHFTLVETLNNALHRACGKLSLWDKRPTPRANIKPSARWWPVFFGLCAGFGFLWAITLLTYLLPPATIWGNLVRGTLTPNQARFLIIGSAVFTAEFALARHLFCRFGCAVGLFQSLVWMSNPQGMVVAFAREQARDCRDCGVDPRRALQAALAAQDASSPSPGARQHAGADVRPGSACDNGCPMRLHPRNIKRMMFSCVQCGQCLDACDESQSAQQRQPLLNWAVGADAVRETLRQRKAEIAAEKAVATTPAEVN